ncbi:trimeric intracellular cation channel family protein [Endozoicomonas arenosclerae]|uniref:trimeric intracellular cation channel family protein n=1 Tax=Endozoicomonas arenosclerae TaxID=1633495 RepID=UPI000AF1C830|nr:trimeric intracellular cation channel family protein [Endozoicomonas arenosclerae]
MLEILYILAITVEAMSGAIAAGRKQMDPFGIIIIATVTAFGGGTIRDLVLNNHPLVWVAHPEYLVVTTVAVIVVIIIRPWIRFLSEAFLVLDAIGLVTFSIIGAQKTLELGHNYLIASIMAVFTGAFGGVLRDILCNQVPLVFRKELYGSISFMAAWIFFLLCMTPLSMTACILITLITGFVARMLAITMNIELPILNFDQKPPKK